MLKSDAVIADSAPQVNLTERQLRNFWRRVEKTDGCWLWTGLTLPKGYGRIRLNGSVELTHRLAWMISRGPIPDGMCVCHQCDEPRCVRFDHLWLGTKADNNRDMFEKGRYARGEACGHSKFSEETVRLMRARYAAGERQCSLMREFGTSSSRIFKIVQGLQWKHVI